LALASLRRGTRLRLATDIRLSAAARKCPQKNLRALSTEPEPGAPGDGHPAHPVVRSSVVSVVCADTNRSCAVLAGTVGAGAPRAGTPRAGTPRAGTPRAGTPRARVNRRSIICVTFVKQVARLHSAFEGEHAPHGVLGGRRRGKPELLLAQLCCAHLLPQMLAGALPSALHPRPLARLVAHHPQDEQGRLQADFALKECGLHRGSLRESSRQGTSRLPLAVAAAHALAHIVRLTGEPQTPPRLRPGQQIGQHSELHVPPPERETQQSNSFIELHDSRSTQILPGGLRRFDAV